MNKFSVNKASVALGSLTATVALLSGLSVASAQQTPAPGGGSFPGSFLVPGTNTSIGIHGFTLLLLAHDFGPHCGDTNCYQSSPPLDGSANHSVKGGTRMNVKPSQFGFETRTPTAYGEVKTFFQFDVNETSNENYISSLSANQAGTGTTTPGSSNGELFRLRQAYGTLGPFLAGQTNSNWYDIQAIPELVDGGGEAAQMNTGTQRTQQIRYTFLAGNGLTLAGSIENPQTMWISNPTGAAGTTLATLADNNSGNGYNQYPVFVGTINLDQPFGNIGLHGALVPEQIRNSSPITLAGAPGAGRTPNIQKMGFAVGLTGHLNTIGKDNFRGGITYMQGAPMFMDGVIGPINRQGMIWNQITGQVSLQEDYGGWLGYQHWWTDNLRSTLSGGWEYMPVADAARTWTPLQQANLEKEHITGHINLIWSPVPFVDIGIEWQSYYRKVASANGGVSDHGRVDRVNTSFLFKY